MMLPPVATGPETIWRPGVVLHVRPPQVTPPRELLTPVGRGDTLGRVACYALPAPGQALTASGWQGFPPPQRVLVVNNSVPVPLSTSAFLGDWGKKGPGDLGNPKGQSCLAPFPWPAVHIATREGAQHCFPYNPLRAPRETPGKDEPAAPRQGTLQVQWVRP